MNPGPVSDSAPGPPDGSPLDAEICVVFSGGGHDLSFVEVEDPEGKGLSNSVGGWGKHALNPELSTLTITPRSIMHALGLGDDFEVLRCSFCDFEYTGPEPAPRERLEAHIRTCPKHPARELFIQLDGLRTLVAGTPRGERVEEVLERWRIK